MFEDVVGHEAERAAFAAAVERWRAGGGGLHHAYLFAGTEEYPAGGRSAAGLIRRPGHGQWRLALELAAAIVAGGDTTSPKPPEFSPYTKALAGRHPDLDVVEREGDLIRYEQVKELVGWLSLKPIAGSHRVWLIDEADTLHPAAANKLLKSLEEPPAHVYFLLTTAVLERMLPTIVSRCHVIELGPVSRAAVQEHLCRTPGLPEAAVTALADLAGGSVERAERLARDEISGRRADALASALAAIGGDGTAREHFISILADGTAEAEKAADAALKIQLARIEVDVPDKRDQKWRSDRAKLRAKREATRAERREALEALDTVAALLRDLWVVGNGASEVVWNRDRADVIAGAVGAPPAVYERLLATAGATRKDLYLNTDPVLALRGMFYRFEEVSRSCVR